MKINFKFLIVLTILLAGCICIGSTFATDSNIDVIDVTSMNNTQNIQIAYDSSINGLVPNPIALDTFTYLNSSINNKNNYTLTQNYKYNPEYDSDFKEGIRITKDNFVLDGNGFTIDGLGLARAFIITGQNVTIKNINFINTNSLSNGGAIYWYNAANGNVSGCTFTKTTAKYDGGAIYWDYSADGVVSGCTFTNAVSGSSGAIYWFGANGVVSGCTFTNTTANDYGGGAIYWSSADGVVSGCTFTNTTANYYGGAIYWSETANGVVSGCTFTNTTSRYGGAIYWFGANGVVSGCTFTNVIASNKGSAIYIDRKGSLNISNCSCNSTNNNALIYNGGIILSPVVITTMDGKTENVVYGEVVNVTGIITTSGMRVAGGVLTLTVNGVNLDANSDETGLYSKEYTVGFAGIKPVTANYNNSPIELQSLVVGNIAAEKLDIDGTSFDDNETTFVEETPVKYDLVNDNMPKAGNPILILLIALCVIGLESFRRKL